MIQHIAVVLDGPEQADRIAPYLSSFAQPGVKIDFLIPAKARQAVWLLARTTALSTHNSSAVALFEQQWDLELNDEKRITERQLTPLSDSLRDQGASIAVRLYSGSSRRALAQLHESHPQSLLILYPQKDWLLGNALRAVKTKIGVRSPTPMSKVSLAFEGPME